MTTRTDSMVELDEFMADLEPELGGCPVPVIERRLRETLIEACERANIWRWEHPEIPVAVGQTEFDLTTPNGESLVHSILDLKHEGRSLHYPVADGVNYHDRDRTNGKAYYVSDRGHIVLLSKPNRASSPVRSLTAPEVPVEPVDPGPVGTGLPATLTLYTPEGPYQGEPQAVNRYWTLNGQASGTVGAAIIIDFSNFTDIIGNSGDGDNDALLLGNSPPSTFSAFTMDVPEQLRDTVRVTTAANAQNINRLMIGDVKAAVADGRPFLMVRATFLNSGQVISDFVSLVDELPVLFNGPADQLSDPVTVGAGSQYFNLSTDVDIDGVNFDRHLFNTANQAEYDKLLAVQSGDFVTFRHAGDVTRVEHVFEFVNPSDPGEFLRYEFANYDLLDADNHTGLRSFSIGDSLYLVVRSASPGVTGQLSFVDEPAAVGNASYTPYAYISGDFLEDYVNRVTQEVRDSYLADIATYTAAVSALRLWESLATRPIVGLQPIITLKPTRYASVIPGVIYRDYYQLIITGTLAKALMMRNRDWSDPEMGMQYKRDFEYDLGKARQAIDRGFVTGSQKVRGRRFI